MKSTIDQILKSLVRNHALEQGGFLACVRVIQDDFFCTVERLQGSWNQSVPNVDDYIYDVHTTVFASAPSVTNYRPLINSIVTVITIDNQLFILDRSNDSRIQLFIDNVSNDNGNTISMGDADNTTNITIAPNDNALIQLFSQGFIYLTGNTCTISADDLLQIKSLNNNVEITANEDLKTTSNNLNITTDNNIALNSQNSIILNSQNAIGFSANNTTLGTILNNICTQLNNIAIDLTALTSYGASHGASIATAVTQIQKDISSLLSN